MTKQLKRQVMNPEFGAMASNNVSLMLSPNGRMLVVFNIGAVPRVWLRNTTTKAYNEVTGQPFTENIFAADFTADGQYLITISSTTANRFGVWSVNYTTGVLTFVKYVSASLIPAASNSVIRRLNDDHFVVFLSGFGGGSNVRIVKLDRTQTPATMVLVTEFAIAGTNEALDAQIGIIPGKDAFIAAKRVDATGNRDITLFKFNRAVPSLTISAAVSFQSAISTAGIAVSTDGKHYAVQGTSQNGQARHGNIAADLSSLTIDVFPSTGRRAVVQEFAFGNSVLFQGGNNGTTPFDIYINFDANYVASNNDGTVLPISPAPPIYSSLANNVQSMRSVTANPPVIAARHVNTVTPDGISIYEEFVENTLTTLFAQGVMGDAFALTVPNTTIDYRAEGVMGDAFAGVLVRDSAELFALGVMGDAIVRGTSERTEFLAQGPMGDAFAGMLIRDNVTFAAVGPMGDAISLVQVNDAYSLVGIGPVADAFAILSDENASFQAVAPMGDAFALLSDERVTFAAVGPMGEAWSNINVHESTSFMAVGPMGEAILIIQDQSLQLDLEAVGIMGDAFSITTDSFVNAMAVAPMGDAGLGLFSVPKGCRRRNMMVLNVL